MPNFMFPNFIPSTVAQITEPAAIALLQIIEQQAITTPLSTASINTSYVHQGNGGTPILLLHGFDSSVLEFRRIVPLLAAENETWAIDLLGFGFTDRLANTPFSPQAIKTHLYYFWKTLIRQPVILVGVSMGGATALDFTLTHPEVVEKLVLIDSAGLTNPPAIGKYMIPPLDYLATEFLRNLRVRDRIGRDADKNPSFATQDALRCGALHLEIPGWRQGLIAFTKSGGYGSFKNKLSQITQQTLILWGDADKILGIGDGQKFKDAIAQSELIWIPDCGHVPHLEMPQITAQHILDFRNHPDTSSRSE
jgi:pimeloyl-ACP methyl ester carboxylesterase